MLKENIKTFLEWKSSYTDKAAYIYGGHLKEFLEFIGDKPLEEIEVENVTAYRQHLHSKHKPSYVNYKMTAVRNFLRYWRENGTNCPSPFFIKYQRVESTPHYAITEGEYRKMLTTLSEAKFEDVKKILAIRLLWETGMRVSELKDLNIQDIDHPGRMAKIMSKKTKEFYWVFWSKETSEVMSKYFGVRLCINCLPEVFISKVAEKRVTTRTMERWIKEISRKAEIQNKVSPHSFRHGRAHYAVAHGAGAFELNKILGHSSKNLNSALNYTRLNSAEMSKIARKYISG